MSNYPVTLDNDTTLYVVHDALRVVLAEDYTPGDDSIAITDPDDVLGIFPPTGIITLTDQCAEIEFRALSFTYAAVTSTGFSGLKLLNNFVDVPKPKNFTNVTLNVMSQHHNAIKDAAIAIEEFLGLRGSMDRSTIEGRINYLRSLVFTPRAWFTVDQRLGLVPFTVKFTDESFRLGCGDVTYLFDFGDGTISSISFVPISGISNIPDNDSSIIIQNLNGGSIYKTYTEPNVYTVKLTVQNEFGEDTVVMPNIVNARIAAPDEAVIEYLPTTTQIFTPGQPTGGPYDTSPPKIRAATGTLIDVVINTGTNPYTGRSYGGEKLDGMGSPIDPIEKYTWSFSDDLNHPNSNIAQASYSIGGLYDLTLRVDTEFGAYRITQYADSLDIIESTNLWLWNFSNTTTVNSFEFGLISELFKTSNTNYTVSRDNSFLTGSNNETQAKHEFSRNTGFTARGSVGSGTGGTAMMFWSSGGSPVINQQINVVEYNGFHDLYINRNPILNRPWNWAFLGANTVSYFLFGQEPGTIVPGTNPSFQIMSGYSLSSLSYINTTLLSTFYQNGADDLENYVSAYTAGVPDNGYFAVYRTTWKDQTGYIIRNDSVGIFYRLKSFYGTLGTISNQLQNVTKLTDMPGNNNLEGELVTLNNGVYFFTNGGSISAYNDVSAVWETGGAASGTTSFRSLQDTTVTGFDSPSNTLLAASDGERTAYLSFDYSTNAFIKFNGSNLTFNSLGSRPSGTQWIMGVN